jgi:hypothetical protein
MKSEGRQSKGATAIKLHPNNMNRGDGLHLSQSWKPLIHSLKECRRPLPLRQCLSPYLARLWSPNSPVGSLALSVLLTSILPPHPSVWPRFSMHSLITLWWNQEAPKNHQSTWRNIPEESHLHTLNCENLKLRFFIQGSMEEVL